MADKEQVIIEYVLQPKGGEKVIATLDDVSESANKAGKAVTAAFSEKQIDSATEKLTKFNSEVEKTTAEFTSAKAELNALTKEITSGKLQGKDLEVAKKRAGELKDRIGDVRSEIGKLASDTRVFDTFVEGARGIAAAFSVAQGAAGLFGDENKDLQKAILKTQSALALLTGAQELANIVTTKGGIASQAYALALRAVDGVQKALAISTTAAWGVIGLAIAGASALLGAFLFKSESAKQATQNIVDSILDENQKLADAQKRADDSRKKEIDDLNAFALKADEARLASAIRSGKGIEQAEITLSQTKISIWKNELEDYKRNIGFSTEAYLQYSKKKAEIDQKIVEEETRIQEILFEIRRKADAKLTVDALERFRLPDRQIDFEVKSLNLIPDEIKMEKAPEIPVKLTPFAPPIEEMQAVADEMTRQYSQALLTSVATLSADVSGFFTAMYSGETQALQDEKERQLLLAGDNAEKRKRIEQKFAIDQAKIKRQQAIAERSAGVFAIAISTAQAIQQAIAADAAVPAIIPPGIPNPAKPASIAGMGIAIGTAVASAALRTAAITSQPLPEIPKFKEGVIGFKGKGSETSDENLVLISNNESVIKAKATSKYRDELQAANDLNLESFIYHKYLLPVLQQKAASEKEADQYDDHLLRRTIKEEQKAASRYIVNGLLQGMREQNYLNQL